MTRTEYRKARRLVRDNGLFALRWLEKTHADCMLKITRPAADVLADRQDARANMHPMLYVPTRSTLAGANRIIARMFKK